MASDCKNHMEQHFYPRPPRGGRQLLHGYLFLLCPISIHALREEGDLVWMHAMLIYQYFYPRPPRGGRRGRNGILPLTLPISIHALREEGDSIPKSNVLHKRPISIHALREEGDP